MTPVRLVLELDPGIELVHGRIGRDELWEPFTGWTELGQAIIRLAQPGPTASATREEQP